MPGRLCHGSIRIECFEHASPDSRHRTHVTEPTSTNGGALLSITDSYVDPAFAARYAAAIDEAPHNALYERPAMLALLPAVSDCHILDAGCGGGWYSEQLLRRGASVTAIDASAALVEHTRRRLSPYLTSEPAPLQVHAANLAEPLAFLADAAVDGVISPLVLHYLGDWRPTLREFRRVLKPGGWLLLSTHHPCADAAHFPGSPYFETDLVEDDWKWVGKVKFFRRPLTEVTSALTDVGFVIDRLVEPMPTDALRAVEPDTYQRLLERPEFLIIRARVS
jgi:SAM-dependent methyltransferase